MTSQLQEALERRSTREVLSPAGPCFGQFLQMPGADIQIGAEH